MEPPSFMSDDIADSLYTGNFGKISTMSTGKLYTHIDELPTEIKNWVRTVQPSTTHIRLGPVMGSELHNRMDWWVGGWENPNGSKPDWTSLFYTQWRKT